MISLCTTEVHGANSKAKKKLMLHVVKGIAFLHSKDIVHRGIKPGNVLLSRSNSETIVKM